MVDMQGNKRDALAIHPGTTQRIQASLDGSSHSLRYDINSAKSNERTTRSTYLWSYKRPDFMSGGRSADADWTSHTNSAPKNADHLLSATC
jgi:hypothetical protein